MKKIIKILSLLSITLCFSQKTIVNKYENKKIGITFSSKYQFEVNDVSDIEFRSEHFGIEILIESIYKKSIKEKEEIKNVNLEELLAGEKGFKIKKIGNKTIYYKSDSPKESVVYFYAQNNKYFYSGGDEFINLPIDEALKLFENLIIKEKL